MFRVKGLPVHISARRTFNEAAVQCLDRFIALAHDYEVRPIIPLIALQSLPTIRSVVDFSALASRPKGSFWTDEEVKADCRHFLHFIVNRTNMVNGIVYKQAPAILCPHLGNEFGNYPDERGLKDEGWSPRIQA